MSLGRGACAGERRDERGQAGRRARVQQIGRMDGRRRIRLHLPGIVPGTRRVRLLPPERQREPELETDECTVGIALGEDAQPPHRAGRPRLQRLAHVTGDLRRGRRIGDERRRLRRGLVDVGTSRNRHADDDAHGGNCRGADDQPHSEPRIHRDDGNRVTIAIFRKAMPTYRELLQQVRAEISEVDAESARELIESGDPVIVDVREQDEWDEGHIPGAVHVSRGHLESRIERAAPDPSRPVLLYCSAGNRSAFAAKTLEEMGYEAVTSLAGGFTDWKRNGFPVELHAGLDAPRRARYSRHLLIPEVGEQGQLKLLDSKVLLIGAGGLGSPAALYLAAAGVGRLGIVDADVVDESNLQRQIVHSTERLGDAKVESAKRTIEALNPDVQVVAYKERLTSDNVERILADGWDVIVDGADNFPTRYLVNDASVWHGMPVVHGSIYRFEGQVTVFKPGAGPCYRCLFPTPPPPELAPSCAEGGVLGVLPGVIGSLQASEALKLALDIGEPLVGRLLLFDALSAEFNEVKLRRDPDCPVCGEHPTITDYIDYVQFCAGTREPA
jgi:sulfur-carrier protein adenylyltransferase/sulfurtransferase